MDPLIGAAVIGVLPATVAAWASVKTKKQVKPSNGSTLAHLMEAHIEQDRLSFEYMRDRLDEIEEQIGSPQQSDVEPHQNGL